MNKLIVGGALQNLKILKSCSVNCCVTSPPYWGLRDYGVEGQVGLEESPDVYVSELVKIFREVRRVLRDDGTLWLNLGDMYAQRRGHGHVECRKAIGDHYGQKKTKFWAAMDAHDIGLKPKDLIGLPWMVAFALRADGWYLRTDIIWHKTNPMPSSVRDRPTPSHEYLFLLSKSSTYYYDREAVKEATSDGTGMRHRRDVWTIPTKPFKGAHFSTFPEKLVVPCVKAGCPEGGVVLDPFFGAGTVGVVCESLNRKWIGIELSAGNAAIARQRMERLK